MDLMLQPGASERVATIERYLDRLGANDTPGILALFAPGAKVVSPFLGEMDAPAFYAKLEQTTNRNIITPLDVFASARTTRVCALFRYEWEVFDGSRVTFDCMDLFDFAPDGARIARMTIIYDTHPVRQSAGDKYAAAEQARRS